MKFTGLRSALFILWMSMFMVESASATVSITTSRIQYSCNGSTTAFVYPFKVYEDDDLEVIKTNSSDSETTLILNTDYTVSGAGDDSGGTVTLDSGSVCPSANTLTILRNIDITQDTDYSDGQTLTADGLEAPSDKSRIIDQQFNEDLDRSIKVIKSSTLTSLEVIPAADQAIFFNSSGTGLETRAPGSVTLAVPADGSVTTDKIADDAINGDKIKDAEIFVFPTMLNLKKGADVASASSLVLGSDGNSFDITGTTTITAVETKGIGTVVRLHFDAILTLTHHATNLILPTGANIITAAGDEVTFIEYASGDWRCINYERASGKSLKGEDYILIRDEKTSGTNGGTSTLGSFQTRNLNTEVADTGNDASVAVNQVTLEAGTYRFRATAPAFKVDLHKCQLYNITDAAVIALGSSESTASGENVVTRCEVLGRFTISAQKVLELQHRSSSTQATNGFGVAASFGTEVYSVIEFWKEVE